MTSVGPRTGRWLEPDWRHARSHPAARGNLGSAGPWGSVGAPSRRGPPAASPSPSSGCSGGHPTCPSRAWTPSACASGACCPEGTLQAPGSGWGVLLREALGWAPSCCGQNLVRDQGWGPTWLQGRGRGLGKGPAEEFRPGVGLEWTSSRKLQTVVSCGSCRRRRLPSAAPAPPRGAGGRVGVSPLLTKQRGRRRARVSQIGRAHV